MADVAYLPSPIKKAARERLGFKIKKKKFLGSGCESHTYAVDKKRVVKITCNENTAILARTIADWPCETFTEVYDVFGVKNEAHIYYFIVAERLKVVNEFTDDERIKDWLCHNHSMGFEKLEYAMKKDWMFGMLDWTLQFCLDIEKLGLAYIDDLFPANVGRSMDGKLKLLDFSHHLVTEGVDMSPVPMLEAKEALDIGKRIKSVFKRKKK